MLAFLQQREQLWTKEWVEAEARRRGETAGGAAARDLRPLRRVVPARGLRGLLVHQRAARDERPHHPSAAASAEHLANIRSIIRQLATEANLRDPEQFSHSWHILMKGSIVAAGEGDVDAAKRGQAMGRLLIAQHH